MEKLNKVLSEKLALTDFIEAKTPNKNSSEIHNKELIPLSERIIESQRQQTPPLAKPQTLDDQDKQRQYRVLQINDHQNTGGAAKAGHRLFTGLLEGKADINLITFVPPVQAEPKCLDWVSCFKELDCKPSFEFLNGQLSQQQKWYEIISSVLENKKPDIVNLHNIHEAIHYHQVPIEVLELLASKAKLVITLHDMWYLTGRCAYSSDCRSFTEIACDKTCPSANEYPALNPSLIPSIIQTKTKIFSKHPDVVLVCPSRWLAGEVKRSFFGNHRIEVIPYGIDLDIFSPDPSRTSFRNKWGIKSDEFVLLSAAADFGDKRKGMHLLGDALRMIKSEVVLMLVGNGISIPALPDNVRVIHQGFVKDQSDMARLYSAADLFICPTLADNLPCVLIESISCGTPCIGFRSGGVPDVIRPNVTGWLADETSAESLAKLMNRIISTPNSAAELRVSCRRIAESEYAINMQAERYEALFRELVENSDIKNHVEKLSDAPSNCAFILNSPEDHYKSIQPLIFSSRQKEACSKLETFLESYPDFALAHNDLGVLLYNQGEKEKAHYHYQQAAELDPENITFQKNLADFYYVELGQVEKALQIYVKILNTNPKDIETLLILGHISIALEKFDDAKSFYHSVLNIQPENTDAKESLEKLEKYQLSFVTEQLDQTNTDFNSKGYLVSAIVSTFNAERFIRGRLEDLENQTIAERLEIVVINSGSQQNEEEVINEFQDKYSNIKYIKTDQRETVYAAWNRGIKASQGRYITNANTDDRLRQDAFEVMVNTLEAHPEIALVYADVIITETENENFEGCTPAGFFNWLNFDRKHLLNKGCFVGPQPMWRREVHDEYGYFDPSFVTSGDYEFWLRISQTNSFMHLPIQLGLYLRSPGSIEHSNRERQREENNKILNMYQKAQVSGKIIRRIPVSPSPGHTETSGENTKSPESIYRSIKAAMENKQTEEVIKELEMLAESFSQFAPAHNDLGVLYYQVGKREKAHQFYKKAVQLDPENMVFQKNLADFLFVEQGKVEEALQIYVNILATHPDDVETLLITGHICVALKKFDDAIEFYQRVLALAPDNEDASKNLQVLMNRQVERPTEKLDSLNDLTVSSTKVEVTDLNTEELGNQDADHQPIVSIIISLEGIQNRVKKCIESISAHTEEPHEIILINNGATKDLLKWAQDLVQDNAHYQLRKCDKIHNWAQGLNLAVKAAAGEYIMLMHNDLIVADPWLSGMLHCFRSGSGVGIVGPMTHATSGIQKAYFSYDRDPNRRESDAKAFYAQNQYRRIPTTQLNSFCLMFRRELIDKIGDFDTHLVSEKAAVADFCKRSAAWGFQNLVAGDVLVYHAGRHNGSRKTSDTVQVPAEDQKRLKENWNKTAGDRRFLKGNQMRSLLETVNKLHQKGYIDQAVAMLLNAIGAAPEEKQLYLDLAEISILLKRYQDAIDTLNEMPADAKTEMDSEKTGNFNEPGPQSPALVVSENNEMKMLEILGYAEEGLENFGTAEAHADRMLSIDPKSARALNLKGILAYREKDSSSAEQFFEKSIASDPSVGEPYSNLATVKLAAGQEEEAWELFEKAFILNPTDLDIATNYHTTVAARGEYKRAEDVVREAAAIYPNSQKISYMLIDVLLQQGKHAEAMGNIEAAIIKFGIENGILAAALKVRGKLGPMTIQPSKKNAAVSCCMIIKDEEKYLARCLASVKPIADEMIVVDTGSADRSKDIATAFGAQVYDFEWDKDFAEARNFSLEKATGDWILILDGDEVISSLDYKHFNQIVKNRPKAPVAYTIVTRNYSVLANIVGWVPNDGKYLNEEAAAGWIPSIKTRLFYGKDQIWFEGAVHELVDSVVKRKGFETKPCNIPIHHYGRLDKERLKRKGKVYFEIGKKKMEKMGDDIFAIREMAIQATTLEENEMAIELWQRLISLDPPELMVADAYINMATLYNRLSNFEQALSVAKKAVATAPHIKESLYNYALAELHVGNAQATITVLKDLVNRMPDYPPAQFILSAAFFCISEKEEGLKIIRKLQATALGPNLVYPIFELAETLLRAQRNEYALLLLGTAIECDIVNKQILELFNKCIQMRETTKNSPERSRPLPLDRQPVYFENWPQ